MKKIFRINVLADIGLLLFEAFWLLKAYDLHINGFHDIYAWGDMGTVPIVIGWLMAALTLFDLIRSIISNAKTELEEKSPAEKKGAWYGFIEIVVLAIYAFVIDYAGYIICTIILLAVTMILSGNKNWKLIAGISVGVTVGLFCVFTYGLHIYLPTVFI